MGKSDSEKNSTKVLAGRVLNVGGELLLPVSLGAVAGFYAADQGMRWLPTMLQIVLGACVVGLAAMAVGRVLAGTAVVASERGARVRKRVLACLVLAVLGLGVWLAVFVTRTPSPLTALSRADFDRAFTIDSRRYTDYRRGMERLLRRLESAPFLAKDRVLSREEGQLLRQSFRSLRAYSMNLDRLRVFYEDFYRFDVSRAERSFHLRSFLLTFAAETCLYEKAARFTKLVLQNNSARKYLNGPSPQHDLPKSSFSLLRQELLGTRDQGRVLAGQQYLKVLEHGLGAREEARELNVDWLWRRALKHLEVIGAVYPVDRTLHTIRADAQFFKRTIRRVWYPTQKSIAEWTGDTRVRRIGWYLIDKKLTEPMDARLEPGDIMVSRKNWYLSNVALPGFWPHGLIYLGAPKKLAAFFDTAEVKAWARGLPGSRAASFTRYLEQRWPSRWREYAMGQHGEPNRVVEAISEGVVFNTLPHAAGDYLAVLRPRLSRLNRAKALLEAFKHVGKPYDFDFDFATDHALVCTELVWRAYQPGEGKEGIRIPLTTVAGRQTLPANLIVKLFAEQHGTAGAQLDFVYFIDAREKERRALVSDKAAFLKTWQRPQWDVVQK